LSRPRASRFRCLLARRLPRTHRMILRALPLLFGALVLSSCHFDRSDRWNVDRVVQSPLCQAGALRCNGVLERCDQAGEHWVTIDDCPTRGLVCAGTLGRCARCLPGAGRCEGETVTTCNADGEGETSGATCETSRGIGCREGACRALCDYA